MKTTKTTEEAILVACDPMRPRWMRELGADLDRMVRLHSEAKDMKRSAAMVSSIEDDINSLLRQISEGI